MEDFNQPSPERIDLLKRLEEKTGRVTLHFWAACQICDLKVLENFLHDQTFVVRGVDIATTTMAHYWGSSPRVQSRSSTPKTPTPQKSTPSNLSPSTSSLPPPSKRQKVLDSSTTLPRDLNIKKRAEERDNFSCVLTGIKIVEVAHIYPHHSMKRKEEDKSSPRHAFWDHLRAFWSEEKVTAWEKQLFPQGIHEKGQEEVYNLISLAPTVRAIWGRGLFALKPISKSDDKKTLTVQFLWQEKQKGHLPRIDLTTAPISTEGLEQTAGVWLFDKNGEKIQSGDYFKLQTDDPIQKPLPSFELLELQWFLHRIQGMAGAGNVEYDHWLDTDSNTDSGTEEAPSLRSDDDVEDFLLLSEEPLSSPEKPANHFLHPKHVTAEVEEDRERERERVIQYERGY